MTICRLCEEKVPTSDLSYHLVHCTAAHSCHERLHQLDRALQTFAVRIRRRKARMHAIFQRIEASLAPLDKILAFCEAVATPSTEDVPSTDADVDRGDSASLASKRPLKAKEATIDPMRETYHIMEVLKKAGRDFAFISDPAIGELAVQASRLANNKMGAYWDLLSLQDPYSGPSASKRPKAYSVSIKEYALVEPLGTGGFGTVWLARRRRTGDLSAIKVLSQEDTLARKMHAAVLLEKNILASADHPCVVKLLFSFATPKHIYMVMEYLPGGDCATLLQSFGFLEEPLALWFCAEALLGLQYLHGSSIIHRDVKPSNMLITDKGHVKLADFGLSTADQRDDDPSDGEPSEGAAQKPSSKKPGLHLRTSAVGTPDYLAPELLTRAGYSYEVDFWALGAVLYQFIVGEPPFFAENVQEIYQRILANDYEKHVEDMSEGANDLILKLLVTNPSERLGGGEQGVSVILQHEFFESLSPEAEPALYLRQSPFTPTLKHETDTSNFEMNALQKAQAMSMRSELERDVVDPSPSYDEKAAATDPATYASDEDHDAENESFKTVNAINVARVQLSAEDASLEEESAPESQSVLFRAGA